MEKLFGLPAHPLMVHFPVVAIPALALLGLVMVARPSFRDSYGMPTVVFGFITAVATFLAAQSGEALADTYTNADFLDDHRSLGEALRIMVLGLFVAMTVLVANARRSQSTDRDPVSMLASIGVLILAVLSLIWTIRTGHEGAKATWG